MSGGGQGRSEKLYNSVWTSICPAPLLMADSSPGANDVVIGP